MKTSTTDPIFAALLDTMNKLNTEDGNYIGHEEAAETLYAAILPIIKSWPAGTDRVTAALAAWFANTKSGWDTAMRAAIYAADQLQTLEAVSSIYEAEPVGWQHRGKRRGAAVFAEWQNGRNQSYDTAEGAEFEERRVYAHPAPISKGVTEPLTEWRAARRAFLELPPGSPLARPALNRLAEAESALYKA